MLYLFKYKNKNIIRLTPDKEKLEILFKDYPDKEKNIFNYSVELGEDLQDNKNTISLINDSTDERLFYKTLSKVKNQHDNPLGGIVRFIDNNYIPSSVKLFNPKIKPTLSFSARKEEYTVIYFNNELEGGMPKKITVEGNTVLRYYMSFIIIGYKHLLNKNFSDLARDYCKFIEGSGEDS